MKRLAAPGLSALLSMGAYCLAMAINGTYPFGARSRAINDLGNQFVPFHAHLWDLMHGNTTGDLFFNWGSGYGVPFLADFITYLMNPFSWLVGIFPRDLVDLPVFLVTLLSIGLGTALMTVLLGRLRPGSAWLRALLSVGYGLCAWVLNDGFADPMWMWGLVALPMIGIAADWCLRRRHWPAGTLLVALSWGGNFYTAAMATLAMALVLLVRLLLATETPVRDRLRSLGRAASMALVGIGLAAPAMTVTLKASKASQPAPTATYKGPPPVLDYLAQLLPGGRGEVQAPHVFVGMLVLLLVATFPFVRAIAVKERVAWCALALVVALSFVWEPTILLWHGLAIPNGSPYRASFVLSSIFVLIAWLALSRRPRPRELGAGAVFVAMLAVLCRERSSVGTSTWVLIVGGGALALAALLGLHRFRADARARTAVTAVLTCGVFLGSAYSAFSVTAIRDKIAWYRPKTTLSDQALAAYDGLKKRSDWPHSRTDPGPHEFANNDPLLLAGEGGSYYSSYLPATTARTLHGLGAGWYIQGRHTLSFEDPVGRALMGVSSYMTYGPQGAEVHRAEPAPLVTVRSEEIPGGAKDGARRAGGNSAKDGEKGAAKDAARGGSDSVFARQERVLGATVYDVPELTPDGGPVPVLRNGGWDIPATPKGGAFTSFTARCAPGTTAYWYAPWYAGQVLALGTTSPGHGRQNTMTANPIKELGTVPADGRLTVKFGSSTPQRVPAHAIGCLSPQKLDRAVEALRARAATEVTAGGHSLRATLPAGSKGTVVIATPPVTGWRCSVDGGPARAPRSFGGLMGVSLGAGGSRVSCAFETPGLKPGLAVSAVALVTLLTVTTAGAVLRRRTAPSTWRDES